jgi:four helix bundle protein
MRDFRELKVWKKAHHLTLASYAATTDFPKEEMFGLRRQIRTAASSIATNVAEGCGRSKGDFGRFLQMAMGSASELEYLVLLSHDLGFIGVDINERLLGAVVEVKKMLASLIGRLTAQV